MASTGEGVPYMRLSALDLACQQSCGARQSDIPVRLHPTTLASNDNEHIGICLPYYTYNGFATRKMTDMSRHSDSKN